MRHRLSLIAIVVALLLGLAILLRAFVGGSGRAVTRERFRGSPIQRSRIDAEIGAVQKESTDALVGGLIDEQQYIPARAMSPYRMNVNEFLLLFGSRRVRRLWHELSEMPQDEACRLAQASFDRSFAAHQRAVSNIIAHYESGAPPNEIALAGTNAALCVSLFYLSEYCPFEQLVGRHHSARQFGSDIEEQLKRLARMPSGVRAMISLYVYPDPLCVANCIANGVARRRDSRYERLEPFLQQLERRSATILPWDADVTHFDVAHLAEGADLDVSKGSRAIDTYLWGNLLVGGQPAKVSRDAQRKYLDSIIEAVR